MEKGFNYAPIWKRIVASLLDYAIVLGILFAVMFKFGALTEDGTYEVSGWPALLPVAFWLLYIVLIEYKFSATLGHQVVKLKVVTQSGLPLSFMDVLKRRICDPLDQIFLIAIILIKNTPNRQRIGDILAKTVVVNE